MENVGIKNAHPDNLERLLSHAARVSPQKSALADPANRNHLERRSDGRPLPSFTFKTLDETVTRLAARLLLIGLRPGDYVLLQLPNFSETPVLVLAAMRAGLVPCLAPLSWSIDELSSSFERLKPKALISCGQFENLNHSEVMRELAFAHLHVRFVMAVGYNIADEVTDITNLCEPQTNDSDPKTLLQPSKRTLGDVGLVTYIDPLTPVPHTHGQILATGLLHVLELGLSSNDHLLCAYPLSSIPGLAAHFYPWLLSGSSLTLHQPFDFDVLQEQLQSTDFSYFAAPEQVIDWLMRGDLPTPQKLAIVRRDSHLPLKELKRTENLQLFDLWNLAGLGCVPAKLVGAQPAGLFPQGRVCLPATTGNPLCLAGAKISNNTLHIKGRIFPGPASLQASLEWLSLKKRFQEDWLDTGLAAFPGPDNSVLLGGNTSVELQKAAS